MYRNIGKICCLCDWILFAFWGFLLALFANFASFGKKIDSKVLLGEDHDEGDWGGSIDCADFDDGE